MGWSVFKGLSADTNFSLEMTPKKKKSLDKKLKTQVTKYENDLEEYLDALDDARRCKYDEVKFAEIIFLITHGSNLANDGKICQVEA